MVFSSHIFIFYFLPLALLLYYASPRGVKSLTLTLVSYVFYGWWNPWFTILMLVSTLIDYGCGKMISAEGASQSRRKTGMILSVISNLSILVFFKYAAFGADSISVLGQWFGFGEVAAPEFLYRVILPVGISFYTFQSMSYSIDLYRGHAQPARSFVDFACYVSMFPQLVAGPIVRYGSVADQLHSRVHNIEGFVAGLTRFNYGFAKKILLANPMGSIADACFGAGDGVLTAPIAWLGVIAYAFQIYFDFSGYSDMAIGLGRMFGFHIPENFNAPYISRSLQEFWRRWHISLSSWFRDYLYIPLTSGRRSAGRGFFSLMVVFLLCGLWHGSNWNFVVWGLVHGMFVALERTAFGSLLNRLWRPVAQGYTLLVVWIAFVLVLPWATFFVTPWCVSKESNAAAAIMLIAYVLIDALVALWLMGGVGGHNGLAWAVLLLGFLSAGVYNFKVCEYQAERAED
ncbi:MAG: MBOAT family protein [Planctomycetes bacterium]|nr:MBOAT family protein [Planctomycetota bacterium]